MFIKITEESSEFFFEYQMRNPARGIYSRILAETKRETVCDIFLRDEEEIAERICKHDPGSPASLFSRGSGDLFAKE